MGWEKQGGQACVGWGWSHGRSVFQSQSKSSSRSNYKTNGALSAVSTASWGPGGTRKRLPGAAGVGPGWRG